MGFDGNRNLWIFWRIALRQLLVASFVLISLSGDLQRDAAVFGARRGIVRNWVILAVTSCFQAPRINTASDQLGHHAICAILRKLQVSCGVALILRVTADSHVDVWVGSQNFREVLQLFL